MHRNPFHGNYPVTEQDLTTWGKSGLVITPESSVGHPVFQMRRAGYQADGLSGLLSYPLKENVHSSAGSLSYVYNGTGCGPGSG